MPIREQIDAVQMGCRDSRHIECEPPIQKSVVGQVGEIPQAEIARGIAFYTMPYFRGRRSSIHPLMSNADTSLRIHICWICMFEQRLEFFRLTEEAAIASAIFQLVTEKDLPFCEVFSCTDQRSEACL